MLKPSGILNASHSESHRCGGGGLAVGSVKRKSTDDEMGYATQVIQEAFPEYEVVWGSHGDYGGGRAPRDHALSFRLRDRWGKYHSNVIWVNPARLAGITVARVKKVVKRGTSHKPRSSRRKSGAVKACRPRRCSRRRRQFGFLGFVAHSAPPLLS